MIPDIYINGVSMMSLGWLREDIDFPTPKPQTEYVTVPGRSTPIRYTEALGRVSFLPRTFTITLVMLGSRYEFDSLVKIVVNRFVGKVCEVTKVETPDVYARGTLMATPSYNALLKKGQLVLSCEDGDSFLYYKTPTVVKITGSGNVILNNAYLPVVPNVTTTNTTTLSWRVGTDTFSKTVGAGSFSFPEMELMQGENSVTVNGTGTTTFTYREGSL